MKKVTYFVCTIILIGLQPSHSQTSDFQAMKFSIGIIGGLNFSNMNFPNQDSEDQRVSTLLVYGGGLTLDAQISENIIARLEPMYLQKGSTIEEGTDAMNQPEGKIRSSAIEIPFLVQYTFGKEIKPYLVIGPTIAYNLKSEIEFELSGLKFKGDMTEVTNKFDFGLTFGGGLQVPISFGKLFLEGRYSYGFTNQRESGTITIDSDLIQYDIISDKKQDKYTNRGFQLLGGILMPFGKN